MEKNKLNRFISRYKLASLVESVAWNVNNNVLQTSFISDDKSVLGTVEMTGFAYPDVELGVYDTTKLTKMLSVLDTDIEFDVIDVDGKPISLKFKDGSTSVNYMLADLSVIPNVPDLKKLPDFNVNIKLDQTFITKFIKATGALSDENMFTFISKEGKNQIILGYSSINTNRIVIDVDADIEGDIDPISFSAVYLREILIANKEATDAILNISTQGLAKIHFEVDEYKSTYFLVEIAA